MKKKEWLDISVMIGPGMVSWPGDPAVRVTRTKNMDKGDRDNVSLLEMGSHTGTHMDAPLHFFKKGKPLNRMPIHAVVGPARVLEIRNKQSIEPQDLKRFRIKPGERILIKTGNSGYWKTGIFHKDFAYITPATAEYLVISGAITVGVDYLSVGGYKKDGALTHQILLKGGIWIIEGLDLSGIKPGEYDLVCLPLKIAGSDGAPARAIIRPSARGM